MNLQEILTTVDTMVPNTLPPGIKIQWINHIQNQLFRDYPVPEAIYPFRTQLGKQFYTLPEDCAEDRIKELVIGKETYPYVEQGAETNYPPERFCSIVTGTLFVHPKPDRAESAFLSYKPRPVQMTADKLEAVPSFPKDYHELLVWGCASRVAKTNPEQLNLANVFDMDFQRLAAKADKDLRKKKQKQVTVSRAWS